MVLPLSHLPRAALLLWSRSCVWIPPDSCKRCREYHLSPVCQSPPFISHTNLPPDSPRICLTAIRWPMFIWPYFLPIPLVSQSPPSIYQIWRLIIILPSFCPIFRAKRSLPSIFAIQQLISLLHPSQLSMSITILCSWKTKVASYMYPAQWIFNHHIQQTAWLRRKGPTSSS